MFVFWVRHKRLLRVLLLGLFLLLDPRATTPAAAVTPGRAADFYSLLGVPKTADATEIKKAHRRLVKKWHPDRYRGSNEKAAAEQFKKVQEAYEVLSDDEKRKIYDVYGAEGLAAAAAGGHPGAGAFNPMGGGFPGGGGPMGGGFQQFTGDPSELFFQMFGGRAGGGRSSFGGGAGGGSFANLFSQMFGMDQQMPGDGFGGAAYNSGFGGSRQTYGRGPGAAQAAPQEYLMEVTLEELFRGGPKIVHVPHRIHAPGSPISYAYKHAYTVNLKRGWKDGTKLRYPATNVMLAQLGLIRIPPVTLKVQARPHRFFERVGDDLLIKVMMHSSQARRKLKLRLPLLDGNQLTYETRGQIEHGSIMEFPDKGMPIKGGPRCGKLFVQFQFSDGRASKFQA